ncbi:MAG: hypothetical protein HYX32_00875 [Actinobacteria bacterium]|nr:hypothetical protein [Actinomycetota bacterium]
MARLKFRDRIYNRKVANAMTSPLGIVLAGGGVAVGLAVGLPVIVAAGLGAAAWAARVALAMPRGLDLDGIDPFQLADPWRGYVWKAKRSKKQYFDAIRSARQGPLRDRLEDIAGRIETGVAECWHIAQSGQALSEARARIDTRSIQTELTQINWGTTGGKPEPGSSKAETVEALESQLATASRLDQVIADTNDRLRLLDARLDEAVTRAIELSARGQQVADLGSLASDVESVVTDMETLRVALDETDRMASGDPTATWSPPPATPAPPAAPAPRSLPADTGSQPPTMPSAVPEPQPRHAQEPPPPPRQRPA